jgi:hypothetical protein
MQQTASTPTKWIISINIDQEPFNSFLEGINNNIVKVKSFLVKAYQYQSWEHVRIGGNLTTEPFDHQLKVLTTRYKQIFQEWQHMMNFKHRPERSMLPFMAEAFSFLFGQDKSAVKYR